MSYESDLFVMLPFENLGVAYWTILDCTRLPFSHFSDVTMSAMASQITGVSIVSIVCSGAGQRNIKAPRHWPLWGESAYDRWIPLTKAINPESVSIWWRHHVIIYCNDTLEYVITGPHSLSPILSCMLARLKNKPTFAWIFDTMSITWLDEFRLRRLKTMT